MQSSRSSRLTPRAALSLWSLGRTGGPRCTTAPCLPEPRATESWAAALVESPRSSWGCPTASQTGWVQRAAPPWWELWLFFSCYNMIEKPPPGAVPDHPHAGSKTQATQPICPVPTRGPGTEAGLRGGGSERPLGVSSHCPPGFPRGWLVGAAVSGLLGPGPSLLTGTRAASFSESCFLLFFFKAFYFYFLNLY